MYSFDAKAFSDYESISNKNSQFWEIELTFEQVWCLTLTYQGCQITLKHAGTQKFEKKKDDIFWRG